MHFIIHTNKFYRTAEDVVPVVIEKHFNSKPSSVETVTEILLTYVEIDSGAFVTSELVKRLSHKTLKVRIGSITTLITAIKSFGVGVIPAKDIMKALIGLFDDSDKKMRDYTMELACEIYKYVGEVLRNSLEGLRSTQLTDINTKFKELDSAPRPTPTRILRSQQGKATTTSKAGNASASKSAPVAFDAGDLFDPIDVLGALKKDWFTQIVSLIFLIFLNYFLG